MSDSCATLILNAIIAKTLGMEKQRPCGNYVPSILKALGASAQASRVDSSLCASKGQRVESASENRIFDAGFYSVRQLIPQFLHKTMGIIPT